MDTSELTLSNETIDAYKTILSNPLEHGFSFKPLKECFEKSEKVTAKHILFEQLIELIKVPLPKIIFYIIMDEMFGFGNDKDENGFLGYSLKIAA